MHQQPVSHVTILKVLSQQAVVVRSGRWIGRDTHREGGGRARGYDDAVGGHDDTVGGSAVLVADPFKSYQVDFKSCQVERSVEGPSDCWG